MIAQLRHRGPDGTGELVDGAIGLAHARLSIIDLAGGAQPIHNEDRTRLGRLQRRDLQLHRAARRAGARAATASTRAPTPRSSSTSTRSTARRSSQHLNGQFAIALWDARAGSACVLARDRARHPAALLHRARAAGCAFASEVKALFAAAATCRARSTRRRSTQIFTFWSPLAPRTVFEGVLVAAARPRHGRRTATARRLQRYWDWAFPERPAAAPRATKPTTRGELRALLVDATRLQLRADVPVGRLPERRPRLVDRHRAGRATSRDTPLRTFSLDLRGRGVRRERATSASWSRYLGTEHTAIALHARGHRRRVSPHVIWHAETPIVRTAPAPLHAAVGPRARRAATRSCSPAKAPTRCSAATTSSRRRRSGASGRARPTRAARPRLLERLYPYLKHSPGRGRRLRAGASSARASSDRDQPVLRAHPALADDRGACAQFFSPELRDAGRARCDPYAAHRCARCPPACRAGRRWRATSTSRRTRCCPATCSRSQGDRMAMAHSVEGRFPFLDHRVIEFANRLPPQLQAARADREVPAEEVPCAACCPDDRAHAHQAALPRARQPELLRAAASPLDYVGELLDGPSARRRPATSIPRRSRKLLREVPQRPRDRLRRQHGLRRHPVDDAPARAVRRRRRARRRRAQPGALCAPAAAH